MTRDTIECALPLYRRALRIREAALGPRHPHVAVSLSSLARLHFLTGRYERAEPLYRRALLIREKLAIEADLLEIPGALEGLAQVYLAEGRLSPALPLLERSLAFSESRLRRETLGWSEERLKHILRLIHDGDELLYNLLDEYPGEPGVQRLALAAALLHKGRSTSEISNLSYVIYSSLGEADREAFQRLRTLRTLLATLQLAGRPLPSSSNPQTRLAELEAEADLIETGLAKHSAPLRAELMLPEPAEVIDRIAAALPPDGALIEIIAFAARSLTLPPGTAPPRRPDPTRYLALVLLPSGDIRAVRLGSASDIDPAVEHMREAFANRSAAYLAPAQHLYQRVFAPLASLVGLRHQLLISPDGSLGLVPWAGMHDGRQFLVDAFDFVYLTSGKDLLRQTESLAAEPQVVVFADPALAAAQPALPAHASLPGARKEAEVIQKLLPMARLFVGEEATKQALLAVSAPAILHIAAHGYFLDQASPSPTSVLPVARDFHHCPLSP